jgi:hypothetical protein
MAEPITVWRFYEAPEELRNLSPHGGDEDWLAEIPQQMETPTWIEAGSAFGACDVSEHEHPTKHAAP